VWCFLTRRSRIRSTCASEARLSDCVVSAALVEISGVERRNDARDNDGVRDEVRPDLRLATPMFAIF
jgi:hypothetical protein